MKQFCPGNDVSTICPVLKNIKRTFAKIAEKSSFTAIIQYTCVNALNFCCLTWFLSILPIPSFFWSIYSYIRTKCRKIGTRKNSVLDTFRAVNNEQNICNVSYLKKTTTFELSGRKNIYWLIKKKLIINYQLKKKFIYN